MHIHMYDSINLWQTYNMYVSVDVTDIYICMPVFIYDMHTLGCCPFSLFLICMLLSFPEVLRDVARPKMMKKEFFNASFPIASLFQLGTEVQIGQIAFLAITRPKIILQCAFWPYICSFVTLDISYFMVYRQKMTPSHQNLRFC